MKNPPIRTSDQILYASTDPRKLHIPSLTGDPAMMGDIRGCRIPALLNAALPDGKSVLLASADIGNEGADWGNLSLALRRSFDGGKTWENPRKIVSLQARRAPQSFDDWQSAFTIDPVLIQAADGRILLIADMWPECKGFGKPEWLDGTTGYVCADGKRWLALYDAPSRVGKNIRDDENTENIKNEVSPGNAYTVREQGWVYDQHGRRTRYYLPQQHDPQHAFSTMGDLYYAVGDGEYLTAPPPLIPQNPDGTAHDIYVGNIFLNAEKPDFKPQTPVFVQKHRAGPGGLEAGYDALSDYEVLETQPAPLRSAVTMFIWMTQSFDGGQTWTQPQDISIGFKRPEDGPFLGVGPGVGLCLRHQHDAAHNGRLLLPLYNGTDEDLRASAAYSDDHGLTWRRAGEESGKIYNRDEVQFAELRDGAVLAFGRRGGGWHDGPGPTPLSKSNDGGRTWTPCPETPLLSVRCQKSVVSYPFDDGSNPLSPFSYPEGMTPGREYLLASCPTGRSGFPDCPRTDGAIVLGEIQDDHSIRWIYRREVSVPGLYDRAEEEKWKRFFGYSCLTILDNGNIGILYEPQPNNMISYFEFSLTWLLEGEFISDQQNPSQ